MRSAPSRVATTALSSPVPAAPWTKSPTGRPVASPIRCTSSSVRCGSSESVWSLTITREAPSSGSCFARSTSASISPCRPALKTSPAWNSLPAATIASPASRRFETSLSGSWSRNTSIPFSAAQATKRRTMSAETGSRADEEAAAEGEAERRRRTRVDRADALPRALDRARARPSRRRRRPRPRGRRSRHGRGSPRSAAPRRSAACPRAGPARAGGWSCRRSSATAVDLTAPG